MIRTEVLAPAKGGVRETRRGRLKEESSSKNAVTA